MSGADLVRAIGRGPGIVGLGYFAITLGFALALLLKDQAVLFGYAAVVTAGMAVVAGGAYKAGVEARANGAKIP